MIAVIVLNWNNAPDTLECLESVYRSTHPNFTVYLADNGSTDGSLETILAQFPNVHVVANGANLGFAEGNNRAMLQALQHGATYLFLLNNDATIRSDTLTLLEQSANNHPEAAAIGPKIYFYDEPTRIWYAGADVNLSTGSFYHNDWGVEEREAPVRPVGPTGYVCGCAFFVRAEAIRQVGLLDARYFLNWEEIDWCRRFQAKGWLCLYDPTPKVWHKIGSSFIGGKRGPMWLYYYWRNRLLWLESHAPLRTRLSLLPEIKRLIKEAFKQKEARASLRGIFDYCRRRFGEGRSFK